METAWLQAFARLPEPAEAAAATEFLKVAAAELGAPAESATDNEAVLAQLCHALLNKKTDLSGIAMLAIHFSFCRHPWFKNCLSGCG